MSPTPIEFHDDGGDPITSDRNGFAFDLGLDAPDAALAPDLNGSVDDSAAEPERTIRELPSSTPADPMTPLGARQFREDRAGGLGDPL